MQEDEVHPPAQPVHVGLRPHEDARAIVRHLQCGQCSYPIREPITLPCGNSICRRCMPLPHIRANITYPRNVDRAQGFDCPFKDCGTEHATADCSLDVMLNKFMEMVKGLVALKTSQSHITLLQLNERLHWRSVVDSNIDVMPRSRVLNGGRIATAFAMADEGDLNYHSELAFTPVAPGTQEDIETADITLFDDLRETARAELECQVCYGLMVDPLTTSCGHTFCRKCIARVLDHSTLCPACRRPMPMRPGVLTEPSNKRVSHIIDGLLGDELAARIVALQEDEAMNQDGWMPLFPCTLAFPLMPTFLHIFEPRYRLMMRRCIQNGSRTFGMLMGNTRRLPQGNLGQSHYMQYGTVLHINRYETFQDGRSLLETQGVYRFKVLEASMVDGYHVARIQRIDDMPLAEEEAAEALETSGPEPEADDAEGQLKHMSTQALLQYSIDFTRQARAQSANWLSSQILQAYGQPPIDPAIFPFWFASVLPIDDAEKYHLLPTTSVRERLKMTVRWIKVLEQARCAAERRRIAILLGIRAQAQTAVETLAPSSEPQAAERETTELYRADDSLVPQDEQNDSPSSESESQSQHPSEPQN